MSLCYTPVAVGLTALLSALPGPAAACGLALVLAVDVSGSVSAREYANQMQGLALALRDPQIAEALVREKAAVALVQWTGSTRQVLSIPWTRIDRYTATEVLADRIAATPREWRNFSTALGEALTFSAAQFAKAPDCKRRVIDLSGDGVGNEGVAPLAVRPMLREAGITVNALAIEETSEGLAEWFRENVITGPGAFVVRADGFDDYPDRIRRKLRREVEPQVSQAMPRAGLK